MKKKVIVTGMLALALFICAGTAFAQNSINMYESYLLIQTCASADGSREGFLAIGKNDKKAWGDGSNLILDTRAAAGTIPAERVFQVEAAGGGWYYIKNIRYGYVDVPGGKNENNLRLITYQKTKGNNQKFRFLDAGGGNFYIQSAIGNKYLNTENTKTSDGTPVVIHSSKGGNNTKWRIFASWGTLATQTVWAGYDHILPDGMFTITEKDWNEKKKREINAEKVLAAVSALPDLDGVSRTYSAIVRPLQGIAEVKDYVGALQDGIKVLNYSKQYKQNKAKGQTYAAELARQATNESLLNLIDNVGSKAMGPIQGSFLTVAVQSVKNVTQSLQKRYTSLNWLSEASTIGLSDLCDSQYDKYAKIGLLMLENGKKPAEIRAVMEGLVKAEQLAK
jgi:hypothetical protein